MDRAQRPYEETLHNLFQLIELEFERIYEENKDLRKRLMEHNIPLPPPAQSQSLLRDKGKLSSKFRQKKDKFVSAWKDMKVDSLEWVVHREFTGHRDGVLEVKISPQTWSQKIIASASADRTARIWDGESFDPLYVLPSHNGCVNSIRFHPFLPIVCTSCGDGVTRFWKLPLGEKPDKGEGKDGNSHFWTPVVPAKRTKSGAQGSEVSQENDGGIADIDKATDLSNSPELIEEIPLMPTASLSRSEEDMVNVAEYVKRAEMVVSGTWKGDVIVWDTSTGSSTPLHVLNAHTDIVTEISSHPIDPLFLTSSADHFVRMWDTRTSTDEFGCTMMNARQEAVRSALFDNTGDFIVTGGDDGNVKIWDTRNLRSSVYQIHCNSGVNRMSVSPMKNLLAVPLDAKHVRIYDIHGNKLGQLKSGHSRMVCSCAWEAHENYIYTSSFDNKILLWSPIYLQSNSSPAVGSVND